MGDVQVFAPNALEPYPLSVFASVEERTDGSTELIVGAEALPVGRIIDCTGRELPVILGARLAPGAPIVIPNKPTGKVQATGDVIRNGQVVRD